jgi:large subunit ribosomal protein L1
MRAIKERVQTEVGSRKAYSVVEAIELLKSLPGPKFEPTIEASIKCNIDGRKSNQMMRGATVLPHGTGRTVRVAVLAAGQEAEEAKAAGAYKVGAEDFINDIKAGNLDFDVLIATPALMREVGQLGSILGPRGLMPNPKLGTVTAQPAEVVRKTLAGRIQYRTDKGGVVHCAIGKMNFEANNLKENLETLLAALLKDKPEAAPKGSAFLQKVYLSSTMGPGLLIDQSSLDMSQAL